MRLDLTKSHRFEHPQHVTLEASLQTCLKLDLNTLEGEQYDYIDGVITVDRSNAFVIIETVRTWEAWRRGKPNAGRARIMFERSDLEAIYVNKHVFFERAERRCHYPICDCEGHSYCPLGGKDGT